MDIFATVVVPVVVSFLGVLFGAHIAGRWQMRADAMSRFMQCRLDAYAALEDALKDFNVQISNADAREMHRAINSAELDNALEAYLKARAYLSGRTDEYLRHLALD